MNDSEINQFGGIAADTAMRAAVTSLRKRNCLPDGAAEIDKLLVMLRQRSKEGFPAAFDDARAATDAGMGKIASATFLASMCVIGIKAADDFIAFKAGQ